MKRVLVLGAGKIGTLIALMLSNEQDYKVHLSDNKIDSHSQKKYLIQKNIKLHSLDINDKNTFTSIIRENDITTIISALPFYLNLEVAEFALHHKLNYFDLTEDVKTTEAVKNLAQKAQQVYVPQCGLAPGLIGIIASYLISLMERVDEIQLRVGALPQFISNQLGYALTWSTDGLINEYINPCKVLKNGQLQYMSPLEGLEKIHFDGLTYEAFNTSGGIGSLCEIYQDTVKHMNYKSIRYRGHCDRMKFLLKDLKLMHTPTQLVEILNNALPTVTQDVVIIYTTVKGYRDNRLFQEFYTKKLYPAKVDGQSWNAIQLSTASGVCSVVDIVLNEDSDLKGFIYQEKIPFEKLRNNRFGAYFNA